MMLARKEGKRAPSSTCPVELFRFAPARYRESGKPNPGNGFSRIGHAGGESTPEYPHPAPKSRRGKSGKIMAGFCRFAACSGAICRTERDVPPLRPK
jgi:hypothetical protein